MTEPKPPIEIDPDDVQLSQEELAEIERKARAQIAKERKDALKKQALDRALEAIRGKAGLVTGDPEKDRLVDITIDVGKSADGVTINGKKYFLGRTYTVPKHVAETIREVCYRTQMHEEEISGKTRLMFKPRNVSLTRHNAGSIESRIAQGMGGRAA